MSDSYSLNRIMNVFKYINAEGVTANISTFTLILALSVLFLKPILQPNFQYALEFLF